MVPKGVKPSFMANSALLVPANRPVAPEPKREVNTRSTSSCHALEKRLLEP